MHMFLILLALCLRKSDGISHLFSIAYAFAGNGWKEFEHRIANKMQTTGLNYYVDGTVVTARYAVQSGSSQQAGVDRIIGWEIVELKAGKIGATRGPVWERTDAQTARYLEWQRTQQATQ